MWIFGGGFALGDTDYGFYAPNFLLSEDNVVVTINYRIGIFGFLDLDCDEYSGNMGLKDQQLALKWIYENIENFAGKKDEILLFGQSAGEYFKMFQDPSFQTVESLKILQVLHLHSSTYSIKNLKNILIVHS